MYTHTKFDHEFHDSPFPSTAYFVCSTPRTGSSLLCEALCQTGLAGVPTEYFDKTTRDQFCQAWQIRDEDYLPTLIRKKTSSNGIFGVKAHYHQFKKAFGVDAVPDFCGQTRFIWVSRRDSVRQAVSYWRAIQTNQWASTHQPTNDAPVFDFEQIAILEEQNHREENCWGEYFDRHHIQPLRLYYEDFSADVTDALQQCLQYLHVAGEYDTSHIKLTLDRQSDALSDEWVRRYQQVRPESGRNA